MDLVRVDRTGDGFWPTREMFELINHQLPKGNRNPLKQLWPWKTQIVRLKKVNSGDYVGYGKVLEASQEMSLAIIPVKYGLNLNNNGKLIAGEFCPVVRTVNMNAVAVDVSHLGSSQAGDEVVLIGNQGENEITGGSFAETSDLINYEMLTRLPAQIPSKIVD